MRRTIWFSLFCLTGVAVLALVQVLSPLVHNHESLTACSIETEGAAAPAAKTDKLVTADELVPDKVTVKTTKIVITPPVAKENGPVVSKRHARRAYARMRTRRHYGTHRHHRRRL